jgi:hypothetical protein
LETCKRTIEAPLRLQFLQKLGLSKENLNLSQPKKNREGKSLDLRSIKDQISLIAAKKFWQKKSNPC